MRTLWKSGVASCVLLLCSIGGAALLFYKPFIDSITPGSDILAVVWIVSWLLALCVGTLGGIGGMLLPFATQRDEAGFLRPRKNMFGTMVASMMEPDQGYCSLSVRLGRKIFVYLGITAGVILGIYLLGQIALKNIVPTIIVIGAIVAIVALAVSAGGNRPGQDAPGGEAYILIVAAAVVAIAFWAGFFDGSWALAVLHWFDGSWLSAAWTGSAHGVSKAAQWLIINPDGIKVALTFVALGAVYACYRLVIAPSKPYNEICPRTPPARSNQAG